MHRCSSDAEWMGVVRRALDAVETMRSTVRRQCSGCWEPHGNADAVAACCCAARLARGRPGSWEFGFLGRSAAVYDHVVRAGRRCCRRAGSRGLSWREGRRCLLDKLDETWGARDNDVVRSSQLPQREPRVGDFGRVQSGSERGGQVARNRDDFAYALAACRHIKSKSIIVPIKPIIRSDFLEEMLWRHNWNFATDTSFHSVA